MTKLYVAKFRYGEPRLARVELERKTPKLYIVKHGTKEALLGYIHIGNRLHRERDHCFFTGQEAIEYLLDEVNKHIADLEYQIEKAEGAKKELGMVLNTLVNEQERA